MTIHYGKRNAGLLTAASPGDTLYIPLQFFNDSGASIGIGATLTAADIEVFKNGSVTQRATDSGYVVLGDTGAFDNRVGFKGISISLFNTADDSTFYAVGSTYWVAIDSVTVDGRTLRFWPAVFEIGEPRANVVAFNDTGVNDRLARIQSDVDTGLRTHISDVDTGLHDILSDYDTGIRDLIADLDSGLRDTLSDYDTGIRALLALRDTGAIAAAVWAKDARTLTGWSFDTGVQQAIARLDTGLRGFIDDIDTGLRDHINNLDTGIADAVWNEALAGHQTAGTAGRNLTLSASILGEFTLTGTPTSTVLRISGGSAVNDFYADLQLVITSGALAGQARPVLSYDGSTGDITVDEPFTSAPASGVTVAVLAAHAHPVTQIASYVWDERDTGHADTGTFGRLRPALAAVRTKTDSLTFTVAGYADVNVQAVNDVTVGGTGDTGIGTPWGPAG